MANNLREMVEDADYIQESALENYDVKKKIFHELDSLTPAGCDFGKQFFRPPHVGDPVSY